MLFISFGFSISHVYCIKGEQWVFGSEMPTCKVTEKSNYYHNNFKNKNCDKRTKDTFDFLFEFDGLTHFSDDFGTNLFLVYFESLNPNQINNDLMFSQQKESLIYFHPPPDILRPDLIKLQTFII
jgi:hypothetical protein